jgi:cell division protein FtsI/penicillin-binding protein 2
MFKSPSNPNSWRRYQQKLKRIARIKTLFDKLPWIGTGMIVLMLFFFVFLHLNLFWFFREEKKVQSPTQETKKNQIEAIQNAKAVASRLLEAQDLDFSPLLQEYFFQAEEGKFRVETAVEIGLQNYIEKILQHSLTLVAAVVVMRPDNGQVLAMAEYQNMKPAIKGNICLKADYPAASLFKMISAAAAIEAKGFSPEKQLFFSGRKYTLYKDQLHKEEQGRFTRQTNLRRAFSGSINPVFGKIGIYDLGQNLIDEYARRFFFKHPIPFELPIGISSVASPEDDYGVAELASGFNKMTRISPLHAALVTATIANNGRMMDPWLIRSIKNEKGETVYQGQAMVLGRPIKPKTAERLQDLMEDTVKTGTCRKTFQSLRRNKLFANMVLGAKTGTINDEHDRVKFDWVTVYALPAQKEKGICVSILTVHGEKLGIRAKDLAKEIINHYFGS